MIKFLTGALVFAFFFCVPRTATCRNFPLQHFTIENGLPSNTIYCLYRDSHGFLWIGTDKGLVKYNGLEFEKFTTNDGLADNDILSMQEDHEGRLWLATYNGELCFYKDGLFHTWVNTPFLKKSVRHSFTDWIFLEKDSSVTITHRDKSTIQNIKGDKCKTIQVGDDITLKHIVLCFNKISESRYLTVCKDQSFIIDTTGNVMPNSLRQNSDIFMIPFAQCRNYLTSAKGIYSNKQELVLRFGKTLASSSIYQIYNDKKDWFIGTGNGLFINNDPLILTGNNVSYVIQDTEKNYWIGTLNNGIYCLEKNYSATNEFKAAYSGAIRYAKAIGRYLFFTTDNGNVYRFADGKAVMLFNYPVSLRQHLPSKNYRESHRTHDYFGHYIDDRYRYYNIEQDFSFVIDKINSNNPVVHFLPKKRDIIGMYDNIKELFFSADAVFVKSSNFISRIIIPEINPDRFIKKDCLVRNSMGNRIWGMAIAPGNTVWYSTFENVNKIIGDTIVPQPQFRDITFKRMKISGNYAVGISNKNQLVICRNYDSNNIRSHVIDGDSVIWNNIYRLNDTTFLVSTDNLYRLLSINNANNHPDSDYTLQIIENNAMPVQAEYICNNDSFFYFFKKGTITKIPVNGLVVKHQAPRIFFKILKTRNKSYPIQEGMKISYNESKNINISFSPFSFGSKFLVCEYSISKDTANYWRQVKNNEINLFEPSFGKYTVKVRARTLSGEFSKPFEFSFVISNPFWATWWFIFSVVLLFLCLLSLTIWVITVSNAKKKEITHKNEIKFLKSEYKTLNALMNPHFIFNTLNNVQWLVNNDDKMTAIHYIRIFSDLVRQNMHNISKDLIPLNKEIELVSNYLKLEKLRFKNALNYEINIDEACDIDQIKVPPLLIQPLVENAIKHGLLMSSKTNNLLKIDIYRQRDKLCINILDNGIGIDESRKKTASQQESTGIENISKRIEKLNLMHNVNITLEISEVHNSEMPTGTLARISIDTGEE